MSEQTAEQVIADTLRRVGDERGTYESDARAILAALGDVVLPLNAKEASWLHDMLWEETQSDPSVGIFESPEAVAIVAKIEAAGGHVVKTCPQHGERHQVGIFCNAAMGTRLACGEPLVIEGGAADA